jgi:hypothetical protein
MKDLDFIDDFLEHRIGKRKSENITDADARDWEEFWTDESEDGGNKT